MQSISKPEQWSMFLRQYAELYAETAITDIRRNQDEQAHLLLQNFARIAGTQEIVRHMQTYEDAMPTSGAEVTEEELRHNIDLVARIRQVRKGL